MVKIPDFAIIFVFYAILNGVVFSVYAYDKRKAQKNGWRTPESQLLFFALLGPFGAYGAMQVFRHKTLKTKFLIVLLFLVLHLAVILYIISSLV
jgi:uncharacterized membrane protein YsdA (DUF1294 family)